MSEAVDPKIKLSGLKVVFANLEDEGFGKSITIDATDQSVQDQISEWVKANKIGKNNPGVANFKEYEKDGNKTLQYAFRINDYTKFAGLNGLTEQNLGYGATVSIVAQAFAYDNKFGKATSASLSAVLIEKAAPTSADGDLSDLLAEHGGQPTDTVLDPADFVENKKIDLSEIPF